MSGTRHVLCCDALYCTVLYGDGLGCVAQYLHLFCSALPCTVMMFESVSTASAGVTLCHVTLCDAMSRYVMPCYSAQSKTKTNTSISHIT